MAGAFAPPVSLSFPIFPLTFKSIPLSFPNPSLFTKSPFIPGPIAIANAKNKLREASGAVTVEYEDFDLDGDDEEVGEDEEFLAFEDMRKWELNRPSGFGEGKVYDTTVEDKLLEEIEKEQMAQVAADKKVKNSSVEMQDQQPKKGVTPSGHSVRLGNLPKKKNIHRDLQFAFKGFAGIISINPAVTGNRKTRDPVCRGFAFVEFTSKEAADRFVSTYSRKDIVFGKVQKQISCEIIIPCQFVDDTQTASQLSYMNFEDETLKKGVISMPLESNTKPVQLTGGTSPLLSDTEEREMSTEHLNISLSNDNENEDQANALGSDISASSFRKQKKQMITKKKLVKKKLAKTAKLTLPASIARLSIKERTVLTGVFSKYGGKITSTAD